MVHTIPIQRRIEQLELSSQRLKLRCFVPSDQAIEVQQRQDATQMKYIRLPETADQATASFQRLLLGWSGDEQAWCALAVERRSDQALVGFLCFRFDSVALQIVEIGYRVNLSFQGQGYGIEMVRLLVEWLIEQAEVRKVVARCQAANVASYSIMQKLGMQREGQLRQSYKVGDRYVDELVYGLLAAEYLAQ